MKKILFYSSIFILLTTLNAKKIKNFTLVEENENRYIINFLMDDIQLETEGDYTKIISESNATTSTLGMPKLPLFTSLIEIDKGIEYSIEYEIKSSHKIKNVNIFPNQGMVNGLERSEVQDIDQNYYDSNDRYPSNNAFLSEPMIMRDIDISILSLIPFAYNPKSKELEVYKSIEVTLTKNTSSNQVEKKQIPKSRVFEKIYKDHVLNYSMDNRDEDYQPSTILYICGGSSSSNSYFQNLIEWRNERGYIVHVASLSETGSTSSSIKNYIQNAYNNWENPPEYVALVGDVGGSYSIPTYYNGFGHNSYGNDCEGDLPYSQLDGNDLLPEVLVGRISVQSSTDLNTVSNKILLYEKATYLNNFGDYYERAAMAGDPSTSGNSCAITKEYVKETLEAHGFEDVEIKTSGGSWSSWMENQLEEGVLYFNYRGYLGMSGFSSSNINNANSGVKLPFATILTCGTGSFAEETTTMSESFLRSGSTSNPKGGVAAIGTATWNTHTLFNNIIDMGIYDGLFADRVETAGAALASGKLALLSTYPGDYDQWVSAFTQWNNLMGDPATHLWTDTPTVLYANHPSSISYGTNFIDVIVTDEFNNPISDAQVTFFISESNNPINKYTDTMGMVSFDIDGDFTSSAKITVTKDNHKPYQGTLAVTNDSLSVNLSMDADIIILDSNDGIAAAGEAVTLSIPIYNYGQSTANNISAVLTSESNYVTINSGSISYGTISPGQNMYGDFDISISPAAIQGEDLEIFITITDGSNEWSSVVDIDVMGSLLYPSSSADISPGDTENIIIELTNIGSLSATGIIAELIYNGNEIEINDSDGTWTDMSSNTSMICNDCFNVTVSGDVISGTQFLLDLHIQTDDGYNRVETFILEAGRVGEEDPLGPDDYGYYIYDSGDLEYNLAPAYNWIEIDPDYGGSGTDLNLSNSGNGNWNGNPLAHVDLPFSFKFYGISYNEITVSPNGWVAMGHSDMEAFRNYPIPGAGGPSPMIAGFWDDLETTSSGDVFIYDTGDSFIIEWSDMRTENNNSIETFQVILLNDSAPPYGDNSIKVQYKEFNNTSSGNFNSYPPIHGGYATIGIENHLADDGIQYTFNNIYPTAAMELEDETAIYITTESPITLPTPNLNYSSSDLNFELAQGEIGSGIITVSNTGEEGSLLSYSISQSYESIDSPFTTPGGGPDSYGYFWSDSNLDEEIDYEWIDISDNSTQVSFETNDSGTEPIDIGFEFPFYGDNYSEFLINANGWIGFGEESDAWYNGNIPSVDAPRLAIFGFWDDLNPVNDNCNASCSGNVYYQSTEDRLVVWFEDVYHWASDGYEDSYYDFQIIIYEDGEIDINHRNIQGAYSATVGIQDASGTIATQVDVYTGDYFEDELSFKFIAPYEPGSWLTLTSDSGLTGEIYNDESVDINVEVTAEEILMGDYMAHIFVSTNIESTIDFPVSLSVSDEGLLLGDVNQDGDINVLDVVSLVSVVLDSGSEYIQAGDMNQDGQLDVLDIVSLVQIILNI